MNFQRFVKCHKVPRNSKYTVHHLVNSTNLARHWFKISVLWGSSYVMDVQWFSKYTDLSWPQKSRYVRPYCIQKFIFKDILWFLNLDIELRIACKEKRSGWKQSPCNRQRVLYLLLANRSAIRGSSSSPRNQGMSLERKSKYRDQPLSFGWTEYHIFMDLQSQCS